MRLEQLGLGLGLGAFRNDSQLQIAGHADRDSPRGQEPAADRA